MSRSDEPQREIEALRERLSRLSQASLRINASLELDAVLQGALDSARSLTGARYGVITLLDDAGRIQDSLSSGMTAEEAARLWDTPDAMLMFEHLGNLSEPLRIPDLLGLLGQFGFPEFRPPVPVDGPVSFLAAPALHRGERVANIFVAGKETDPEFTLQDEETLVMFAAQAALVIANARRHRDERRVRNDLETLINTSPVGVVVFDANAGVPLYFNREALRIVDGLGSSDQSPQELLDSLVIRRDDGRDVALAELPLARLMSAGETVRAEEMALIAPDGRSVTALINATPVRREAGASDGSEVESYVVTLQDLAPMQELDRLRADFLAMASHEMRTPLTSIKGAAATVLGGSATFGPAEMMQFFRIIDRQADHMSGLINDLLDAARIDTGTLPVNPEPALVAALVDQARSAFISRGTGHNIVIDLPPDLPRVTADPQRIVQVLDNLLSNAAKHSPEASSIRVSARSEDFQVAVSVADRGSGLPAERLPLLFRKFSRTETEDRIGDTGLGLAISKGIVEAHGGRIWAESDGPGRGAEFTFTLPVAQEAMVAAPTMPSQPLAGARPAEQERVRILVVDDDPQALSHLRNLLNDAGYVPTLTGDPEEALRLMATGAPHLALLDLLLPGTDGIELMQELRAVADIPVIFLSAYGQEDVVSRAFDTGADDYVVKPFSPTELSARIRAALRRRASLAPPEPSEPYVRGDLVFHYAERSVSVAGNRVRLTVLEHRLLFELAVNSGSTLTYDHLLERIWNRPGDGDLRPLRTVVRSLRRKLGDDADNPKYIFTEPRVGYWMIRSEERAESTSW